MKLALSALAAVAIFAAGCQKKINNQPGAMALSSTAVDQNALLPLACHSTSFSTVYPVKPGEVPPFSFSKVLYSDTRVKSIEMLSRVYPIYPGYPKQGVELMGNFTYGPYRGYLKGSSQIWEYYRTATGAGARQAVVKRNVNLKFYFNEQGYCYRVTDLDANPGVTEEWQEFDLVTVGYQLANPHSYNFISAAVLAPTGYYATKLYYANLDNYGNIVSFYFPYEGPYSYTTYAYDYNIPRNGKNYSFIPSQNLISQEYSLLEVMQWLPQPTHQRKAVAGNFYLANGVKIVQSQVYRNYMFDAKGNQISLTYGDNIPQKTSWYCR